MGKCAVFLRAVNIGKRQVPMARLRQVLEREGFAGARTFIQTGNLLIDAEEPGEKLEARFEKLLLAEFGFEVPAMARPLKTVKDLVARNPFKAVEPAEDVRFCVTFLKHPAGTELPALDGVTILESKGGEVAYVLKVGDRMANYGAGIEKRLKVPTTTRFFGMLEKFVAWSDES